MTESHTATTTTPPELRVLVLTREGCMGCRATYRQLAAGDITPILVDVDKHPDLPTMFGQVGHLALPIVIGPTGHWSGHRDDRVAALIQHVHGRREAAA